MYKTNLDENTTLRKVYDQRGNFKVLGTMSARDAGFNEQYYDPTKDGLGICKRQLLYTLDGTKGLITQSGAMQMMVGDIQATTDVKGVGDLAKKVFSSVATKESAIKPKYTGTGIFAFEATTKHIILLEVANWSGGIVLEDGLFLAAEDTIQLKTVARSTVSSAVLGNEGLFNLCLTGSGICAIESRVPRSELVEIALKDDVVRIDGSYALAWSGSLQFTVERTTKTLMGSSASGEGLVNVYRGTGKILAAPACYMYT